MLAIISDIHGNLEALDAVLADAERHGAKKIYCLGDIVGYGPDPIACLHYAMSWPVVLQGNFEAAILTEDDLSRWVVPVAQKTVLRLRRRLRQFENRELRMFMASLKTSYSEDNALYVHATPRDHMTEYLSPDDVHAPRMLDDIAKRVPGICFCGHTHLPGVFQKTSASKWQFVTPEHCKFQFPINDSKLICNVGSVGQPRDGNPAAGYVLFDGNEITFRRISYDFETTASKLRDDGDDFCARILAGR